MSILDANFKLVKEVLNRYESLDEIDIYLTHHKYVKGLGEGRCWKLIDDKQVELLENSHIFRQIEKPVPNPNHLTLNVYHGDFLVHEAREWYEKEIMKRQGKPNWEWLNKSKNEYQFGKVTFSQRGKTRGEVFRALIDLYEKSPLAVSVKSLSQMTGVKPYNLRIEISAINKRLKPKIGYYFKGSKRGYYTLEKYIPPTSSK